MMHSTLKVVAMLKFWFFTKLEYSGKELVIRSLLYFRCRCDISQCMLGYAQVDQLT